MRNIEIMLNQCFSRKIEGVDLKKYVLPDYLGPIINRANENFDTGRELRLQKVYTYELWARLESLGLGSFDWANKKTLDICCGTGYLSYHLLQRASPKELTLLDISEDEVGQAKALLSKEFPAKNISYVVGDALNSGLPDKSFDVIIGNSFLHHFRNLPVFIKEVSRLLKDGGIFVSLHEPTIASTAFESRNHLAKILYLIKGRSYIDFISNRYFKKFPGKLVREGGGADVWVFDKNDLTALFESADFDPVIATSWNFARPIVAVIFSLHLSERKPKLSPFEERILAFAISVDKCLRRILPDSFFASVAISAKKR